MAFTSLIYTINQKHMEDGSLIEMLNKGICAFRINLGRTSGEQCCNMCEYLKEYGRKTGKDIKIEIDLPGAKARVVTGESYIPRMGEQLSISDDLQSDGKLFTDANWLFERIQIGDIIRIGHGVEAEVLEKRKHVIIIKVLVSGKIHTRDMILVKNRVLELPQVTKDDINLIKLIRNADFDYLALSFSQTVSQIEGIKSLLKSEGLDSVKLIAKIEEQKGMSNYREILEKVDGILIGRGDMSSYVGMQETNAFIASVLDNWSWKPGEKECILASYYFLDLLTKGTKVDPVMAEQSRFPVTYFVTDESSYHDWKRIYGAYNEQLKLAGYLDLAGEKIGLYCNEISIYNYLNSLFALEQSDTVQENARIEFFYVGEEKEGKIDYSVTRKDNEVYVSEKHKALEYKNNVAKCTILASVKNAEALYYTYALPSLKIIMAEHGKICVHGAAYQTENGKTVAVIGPSGCGKTTLSVLMMNSGMTVLTDDLFFVDLKNRMLSTFERPAHVDISLCEHYAWLREWLKDSKPYMKGKTKYNLYFHKMNGVKSTLTMGLPDLLLFPLIGDQEDVQLRPVSPRAAISRMLSQMYFHKGSNSQNVIDFVECYKNQCKLLLLGKKMRSDPLNEIQRIVELIS